MNPIQSRRMRYHGKDANTVALWNGFGDKTDSSGNGLNLTLTEGTERYGELGHGLQGFALDTLTSYSRAANDSVLNLVGDMTIEAIVRVFDASAIRTVCAYVATGETGGNDNELWSMACDVATANGLPAFTNGFLMTFQWETGAGSNQSKTGVLLNPLNQPVHLAWVRSGTSLIPYVNGFAQPAITGITNGTLGGAPAQTFRLGADLGPSQRFSGIIGSVKISNVARSAAYIRKDAILTMGMGPGLLDPSGAGGAI